jgi:hypothetical protein
MKGFTAAPCTSADADVGSESTVRRGWYPQYSFKFARQFKRVQRLEVAEPLPIILALERVHL